MKWTLALGGASLALACAPVLAQDAPKPAAPAAAPANPFVSQPLGNGPWDIASEKGPLVVEVFAKQLDHPWSMAFLPDGAMLVTERVGRLRVIRNGKLDPVAIAGLPPINPQGIGGLMDVVLDPDFANNRLLYISYTKPGDDVRENATLAVLRARWDGGMSLSDVQDIFIADAWYGATPWPKRCCGQGPASGSFGGRIAFGADGKLYVTSGDRNYGEKVQDPSNHFGVTLRLNPDGSVPSDNPFVGKAGYKPEIWTLGHRNPTGLTVQPGTGAIWETEMGPRGGDELNLLKAGANYGWMDVTQGEHYNNEPAKAKKGVKGMTDAAAVWGPSSINPGGIDFYDGTRIAGWQGNLLLATMTRKLVRMEVDGKGQITHQEQLLQDVGQRLRAVTVGPDGYVYVLTDETAGAILKIGPG